MTTTLAIPAGDRGAVRVFAVDLPPEAARAFAADPDALARALGGAIDPGKAEVFPVSRLADLGLRGYLAEGHGIPAEALLPDAAALDALDGHVAVLAGGAFGPAARTVTVSPPLRLVGTYSETVPPVTFTPLPAGSATGVLGGSAGAKVPTPGGSGLTRMLTVLLLILAIVGFIVLNGGQ